MIVYVQADNAYGEVTNISLVQLRNNYIEAVLDDPQIDLSKLNRYALKYDEDGKQYHLIYDEEKYNETVKSKEKDAAIEAGNKKLDEMQATMALTYATDEDAYTMRYIYEEWAPGMTYKTGDRRLFGDNLYKCRQDHESQEQYTPDTIPALWDILGEKQKGTIDDPVVVPEVVSSMVYVKGKYYLEGEVLYLMNREGMTDGEEISLTFKPSELVGQYFEIVNK